MTKLTTFIILSILLSGCALFKEKPPIEKIVYVTSPIYAPEPSVLPKLKAADFQCLSLEVKQKLLERDKLLHKDRDIYKAIIESTQK